MSIISPCIFQRYKTLVTFVTFVFMVLFGNHRLLVGLDYSVVHLDPKMGKLKNIWGKSSYLLPQVKKRSIVSQN